MSAKEQLRKKLRAMLLTGYKHANIVLWIPKGERILHIKVKI